MTERTDPQDHDQHTAGMRCPVYDRCTVAAPAADRPHVSDPRPFSRFTVVSILAMGYVSGTLAVVLRSGYGAGCWAGGRLRSWWRSIRRSAAYTWSSARRTDARRPAVIPLSWDRAATTAGRIPPYVKIIIAVACVAGALVIWGVIIL